MQTGVLKSIGSYYKRTAYLILRRLNSFPTLLKCSERYITRPTG